MPDRDDAQAIVALLAPHAIQQIPHPSGRPWMMGIWEPDSVAVGRAGRTAVALMGQHAARAEDLEWLATRTRAITDADRYARTLPGSFHLAVSHAGHVRLQGTVTGIRRVFHARTRGQTVAADRADVLAWLLGSGVDERLLALHLLHPSILYPLTGRPVWRGVDEVPPGHYLALDPGGRHRTVRWWRPPEPEVPLAEGAGALRDALTAAVAVRARGADLVSCDLGGLDSTSVCCLAAREARTLAAYTAETRDPLGDDTRWAVRTVAEFPNIEHHILSGAEMPMHYHDVKGMSEPFDEPCAVTSDRERWLVIVRRAAARGSTMHLTGFGGDELLYGSLAHLHTLLPRSPGAALHALRGFAAKYRWSRGQLARQLIDRRSYRSWLARIGDCLTLPPDGLEVPLLEWGFRPRLPTWATPETVHAVRDLIRTEAGDTEPLSPHRGTHRELESMRFVCRLTRQLGQLAGRLGVRVAAPYYDDRVIEAGLSVRPLERVTPWRYKPLIVEAMRGVVPEASLARQTKANADYEGVEGLREHRGEVLELWEDSHLARLGLIDAEAVRRFSGGPAANLEAAALLEPTVACEMWLRTLDRPGDTPPVDCSTRREPS